jgi:hypothetical protein
MFAPSTFFAGFLVVLLASAGPAGAIGPEPTQVGRFSSVEGDVQISYGESDEAWDRASVNYLVAGGARIFAGPYARAEIQAGPNALRLGGQALLDVVTLEDRALQLRLEEGALGLALRDLPPGGQFEVATPRAAVTFRAPGTYRIDAGPEAESTRITVRSGEALVRYRDGEIPLNAGRGVTVSATELAEFDAAAAYALDEFDRWAYARGAEEGGYSGNVPRYVTGYEELERSGTWSTYSGYGTLWTPGSAWGWWSPYTYGRWAWVPPWGWTWVDDAPWAFPTFRIGHWAFLQGRWWWAPGAFGAWPVYAGYVPFFPGQIIFSTSFLVHGKPAHHFVPLKPKRLTAAKRSLHHQDWRRAGFAAPATGLPPGIGSRGGAESRPRIFVAAPPGASAPRRGFAEPAAAASAQPARVERVEGFRRGAPAGDPWRSGLRRDDARAPVSGAILNPSRVEIPAALGGGLTPRSAAGIPYRGGGDSARQGGGRSQGTGPMAAPSGSSNSGGRGSGGGRR